MEKHGTTLSSIIWTITKVNLRTMVAIGRIRAQEVASRIRIGLRILKRRVRSTILRAKIKQKRRTCPVMPRTQRSIRPPQVGGEAIPAGVAERVGPVIASLKRRTPTIGEVSRAGQPMSLRRMMLLLQVPRSRPKAGLDLVSVNGTLVKRTRRPNTRTTPLSSLKSKTKTSYSNPMKTLLREQAQRNRLRPGAGARSIRATSVQLNQRKRNKTSH